MKLEIPNISTNVYSKNLADKQSLLEKFKHDFMTEIAKEVPDCEEFIGLAWTDDFLQIRDKSQLYKGKPIKSLKKGTTIEITAALVDTIKSFVEQEKAKKIKKVEHLETLDRFRLAFAPVRAHLKILYQLSSVSISNDFSTITIRLHEDTEYLTPFASIKIDSEGTISEPNLDGGYAQVSTISGALKFIEDNKESFELLTELANEAKSMLPDEFLTKK